MKSTLIVLCLLLVAVPCQAATYLELGSSPVVSIMWEKPSFAFGVGTGFGLSTNHTSDPFFGDVDQTFISFNPTVTGQLFLYQDPHVSSFLELRVSKGVPIFSGPRTDVLEQFSDDWSFGPGFGLRSAVAERLNIGGAADYSITIRTGSGISTSVASGTGFRVFLQYRL